MNKIIWALYDDANGSWNKLNKGVISIGINDNKDWTNYYKIDLSIQNNNLISELKKLPKPNIIVASPPCESWSIADNQRRLYRSCVGGVITMFSYLDEMKNRELFNNGKRDYYKQWSTTLNGISTIIGTLKIIDYFKPKYWVIENPATSKIWEFVEQIFNIRGYKNKTYYNAYNSEFTKKPTIFFSNVELNLKKDSIKQNRKWEAIQDYNIRSSIPSELLNHILEQLK